MKAKKQVSASDQSGLSPFAVSGRDGHYSVLQCKDVAHCKDRISVEYLTKKVVTITPVL